MIRKFSVLAAAVLSAALAFSTPAVAQMARVEGASAEQLATASAEADALIAAVGDDARHLFENISADGMVRIRHKPSGLVCTYVPGAQNNALQVYRGHGPLGDDVGCNTDMGPAYLTYYATRYGPGYSATDSARDAAAAIRNRFPDARPYEGMTARVEPPTGVTETGYAALLIGPESAPRYTHALTAKVGEWIFKQRMTGDGTEDAIMANQIMAGAFFNEILVGATTR
ncbi:hypothetical protein [Brevundimonas sp. FT23042]|uniref:hypothetical protein n=1 Tax=Brevundimonas sp. FT23042 TaxID=3393749 RepID=UPI003B58ACF8